MGATPCRARPGAVPARPAAGAVKRMAAVRQQQRPARRRPPPPPAARRVAAASDAEDDFQGMLGRRELLRAKGDLEEGLSTDEDEELADLTERLAKFGYLEDEEDEEDDSEDEVATSDEEDEVEEEEEEEEAQAQGERPSRRTMAAVRAEAEANLVIDDIVSEAQRSGAADMRNMGMFETAAPGVAAQAGEEAREPGEEPPEARFPQPPARSYQLGELLRLAGYEEEAASAPDVTVSGLLTCNSLKGVEGGLYVCTDSPEGHDGHEWADEASEMGAVAVLAARPLPDALLPVAVVPDLPAALARVADAFYERPSRRMRTVGVVGSYGKTATSWLARGMFEETGERCGLIGTIEYALEEVRLSEEGEVWVPEEEDVTLQRDCSSPFHITPYAGKYPALPSTPDALHLQKALAGCADRGAAVALVELDPAALGDGRADPLDWDVLVYTNSFADKEEEAPGGAAECRERVARLLRTVHGDVERQRAVVNVDDPVGQQMAAEALAAGATLLTYSLDGREADVFAEKVKSTIWETEVLVNTPLGRLQIITPLLGRSNVHNVLAAVATGIACGVPLKSIVAGVEAVDIVPGRCEIIDEGQPFSVVVDSAHTPAQLSRLLDEVKEAGARRVLCVFGCHGDTSSEQRAEMTRMAHFKADAVYITNDSPGAAWPSDVVADMVAGLPAEVLNKYAGTAHPWLQDPHRVPHWFQKFLLQYQSVAGVYVIEDRFQAIRVAVGMARARDVVVVAGKGHIDWQEYWDGAEWDPEQRTTLKSWFDDRVECRNALSKLPYLNGIKDLNTDVLPWTRYPEERDVLTLEGIQEAPVGDFR